jgi:hypothetical protein
MASAQIVQPSPEDGVISVIYTKEDAVDVTLETSLDLANWVPTPSRDALLEDLEDGQVIKSTLPAGEGKPPYIRLASWPAWQVTLTWDPVDDPAVIGYRVYWTPVEAGIDHREPRRLDVGLTNAAVISLPEDSQAYTFVVTCYNLDGLESLPSEPALAVPGERPSVNR